MAKYKTVKKLPVKEVTDDESEAEVEDLEEDESEGPDEGDDDDDDGSEGDIVVESLEEVKSNKRKLEGSDNEEDEDEDEETGSRKKRKTKKKHVKPPTAEEMLALRETENLYQSNLFRLQIEEMLSELKPKKSTKRHINPWMESFTNFLKGLSESESCDMSNLDWLEKQNIIFPLKIIKSKGRDLADLSDNTFTFKPPVDVFLVGSHSLGCPLGPCYSIDVAVVMPKNIILKKDNLNMKYHVRRALYLCYIAVQLKDSELVSSEHEMEFSFLNSDRRKPLLLVRPSGKISKSITVRLHPIPEENSFKFQRFFPTKNNCRSDWWGLKKDISPPTPMYNASILEDMVLKQNHLLKKEIFDQNQGLKDTFVLLRVWLKQRELSEGFGSINSHLLSMLLVHLMKISKINKYMSSYQIIRHVWLYLSDSNWLENGPSLCDIKKEDAPTIEEFHTYYDVVFIDATGYSNIAAFVNKYFYLRLKDESKLAMQHLDNREIDGFKALFISKMPFIRQYDTVISFSDFSSIASIVEEKGDSVNIMDFSNNILPEFFRLVTDLLEKGIGQRLTKIGIRDTDTGSWGVSSNRPPFTTACVGYCLNTSTALSLIDKGPQPTESEAEEFREFWKEKCELRRFKDGNICEAVAWEEKNTSLGKRRRITDEIALYLLKSKLDAKSINISSRTFFGAVRCQSPIYKMREEACQRVLTAYEDLARQLRDLPDLPLSIVSVHCISPVYRFTEPFPPVKPSFHRNISPLVNDPVKGRLFGCEGKLIGKFPPEYIPPVDCVMQMALTKAWPNDVNAGKRLIAAFNIAITESLKKHCNLSCQVTTDYFVVNKDGYLFRIHLGYSKAIGLLKLKISEDERQGEKRYRDTPESVALEMKFINLPKITGAIYRLSQEFTGFSEATSLAKRWLGSQLLDDSHFPEPLTEMLMAHVFLTPQPFLPALAPLPNFLRFLALLSTTDWSLTPIIVNFNSILTGEDIKEIENSFREERSLYPPLVIATPYDKSGSLWSRSAPTLPTLIRLTKLAGATLLLLEKNILCSSNFENLQKVFIPPMSVYDAVIKLNKPFQFRKDQKFSRGHVLPCQKLTPDRDPILPILGFNPADLYLEDLRKNYGEFALFFHDPYGGVEIGVLFKPGFLQDIKFKSTQTQARKPIVEDNKNCIMKPHIDSIFEGFKILGNGIVENIELKKLKEKSFESVICS